MFGKKRWRNMQEYFRVQNQINKKGDAAMAEIDEIHAALAIVEGRGE